MLKLDQVVKYYNNKLKIKELEKENAKLMEEIKAETNNQTTTIENFNLKWVDGYSKETLNLKKLKDNAPKTYEDLLKKYGEVKETKGYFNITKQ